MYLESRAVEVTGESGAEVDNDERLTNHDCVKAENTSCLSTAGTWMNGIGFPFLSTCGFGIVRRSVLALS